MHFTTKNLPYSAGHSPMTEKLPSFDPVSLMMKRKQQSETEDLPDIPELDQMDVEALQDFCAQMGIAGVSSKLPPKAMLSMLRAKMGDRDSVISAMEKQGCRVTGKNYPQDKQILKG